VSRKPAKKATKTTKAKKQAKNKGGRPSLYRPALLEAIRLRLSKGEPLAAICRDEGMPDDDTVRNWMEHKVYGPEVSRLVARAREAGFDAIAAHCLDIADNSPLAELKSQVEAMIELLGDEGDENVARTIEAIEGLERRFNDMVQERKLRIETRLKLLACWDPKRYGQRQTVEHQGKIGLEALVAGAGDDSA
jgi:hypothetical protein